MAKRNPRMRRDNAAPSGTISELKAPPTEEAFPPLTISLETFVKNGSDQAFRRLIFELIALHNQMQRHRRLDAIGVHRLLVPFESGSRDIG